MVKFGGNEFTSFSVPLVFAGRVFVLEPGSPPCLSVFLEHEGGAVFEVLRNSPVENQFSRVERSGAGITTITDKSTGRFLYKVRPGSETSVAFGTLTGTDVEAKVTDKMIRVGGVTLQNNTFNGVMAGVVVNADGSVGIGAPLPASVVKLLR